MGLLSKKLQSFCQYDVNYTDIQAYYQGDQYDNRSQTDSLLPRWPTDSFQLIKKTSKDGGFRIH